MNTVDAQVCQLGLKQSSMITALSAQLFGILAHGSGFFNIENWRNDQGQGEATAQLSGVQGQYCRALRNNEENDALLYIK